MLCIKIQVFFLKLKFASIKIIGKRTMILLDMVFHTFEAQVNTAKVSIYLKNLEFLKR